jgi:signal transduction histidine kinase
MSAPVMETEAPESAPPSLSPLRVPPPRRGLRRMRLGHWYALAGLLLSLLVLTAVTLALLALRANTETRDQLVNQIDPAALQQTQLFNAVSAQNSAIRDVIDNDAENAVASFREAAAAEQRTAAAMRRLIDDVPGGGPSVQQLDRLSAASATWRAQYAEPVAAGRPTSVNGDPLFAEIRNANAELQRRLTVLHGEYDQRLRDRERTLYASLALTLGVIAFVAVALVLLIRRTVLRPVAQLSDQVRAVAEGDFAHPLDVARPVELAELAAIINSMRHRIIQEWRTSSEARLLVAEQAAELRSSNAELEQFAYVASHDLQEPLRKVASFCQMLEKRYGDQLDDRGKQYIDFAVDGAKRMQALINDLLSFSRVGRFTRPEESVDLDTVLAGALDNLSHRIEDHQAEVVADELPKVAGDRSLLTQLLQNLIGNAIKFQGEQPPVVRLTARRDGVMWEFTCADNGIGIDAKYADRIFLIFQRLHSREEYTGTGIGLALCKKIVEHHGGRIWLDTSHEGPGTTFRWTLPALEGDE